MRYLSTPVAILLGAALIALAVYLKPSPRYQIDGGLRLDTTTGEVTQCMPTNDGHALCGQALRRASGLP
jgi:hypothetical protein